MSRWAFVTMKKELGAPAAIALNFQAMNLTVHGVRRRRRWRFTTRRRTTKLTDEKGTVLIDMGAEAHLDPA